MCLAPELWQNARVAAVRAKDGGGLRLSVSSRMFDPNSPTNSEAPPLAAGQSHSAAQLHTHPLWRQAAGQARPMQPPAGRGRGRGRGGQAPVDPDGGARYERISLLAVELQQGATGADGADSALMSSEDEGDDDFRRRVEDDEEEEEPYDHEEEAEAVSAVGSDDEGMSKRPRKGGRHHKPQNKPRNPSDMMAAAAFGGGQDLFGDDSDSASMVSGTSSKRKRDTMKAAFPVKGVNCVGCALANRIAPVERFINTNVGRMSETALWKMAALTWKLEVVEPAKKEGVDVVQWPWRDVANHFRLHTTNTVVGRTHMIQSLTAMRCQIEQRLVRVENGERELDKTNADLCLKVIAAESRERTLLSSSMGGGSGGRGKGGQRPAGED